MKNLIREIVRTDKESRLEVEKAEQRRDMLSKEIDEQTKTFELKCAEEAKAKIEMAKQQLESGLEENRERINRETLEKTEALKAEFEKNHVEWENSIFEKTIS